MIGGLLLSILCGTFLIMTAEIDPGIIPPSILYSANNDIHNENNNNGFMFNENETGINGYNNGYNNNNNISFTILLSEMDHKIESMFSMYCKTHGNGVWNFIFNHRTISAVSRVSGS